METIIGTYYLKTHLAEVLNKLEAGESFVITRNGREAARLVPPGMDLDERRRKALAAGEKWKGLSRNTSIGGFSLDELKNDGRKY